MTQEHGDSIAAQAVRLTSESHQMRQAEAVGEDDELHVVEVGAGAELPGVEVLQHRPHAALAGVRKCHLRDAHRHHPATVPACPPLPAGSVLTSLVELSTKGPPNIAAIQSQLEMSRGLWALIAPSSSTKVTSGDKQRDAAGTIPVTQGSGTPCLTLGTTEGREQSLAHPVFSP